MCGARVLLVVGTLFTSASEAVFGAKQGQFQELTDEAIVDPTAMCSNVNGKATVDKLWTQVHQHCKSYPRNAPGCVNSVKHSYNNFIAGMRPCSCRFFTFIGENLWDKRPLAAMVKSFLLTQKVSTLTIYTTGVKSQQDVFETPYLKTCQKLSSKDRLRIQVKDASEIFQTVDGLKWCSSDCESKKTSMDAAPVVALTDLLRVHALHSHGGIWVDGDTLFLRDMSSLCGGNFAYPWSVQTSALSLCESYND